MCLRVAIVSIQLVNTREGLRAVLINSSCCYHHQFLLLILSELPREAGGLGPLPVLPV